MFGTSAVPAGVDYREEGFLRGYFEPRLAVRQGRTWTGTRILGVSALLLALSWIVWALVS